MPVSPSANWRAFDGGTSAPLVFWFFAKFRPASGDPGLGFGAPFWPPGRVFTARGLEKRKLKNFESRCKALLVAWPGFRGPQKTSFWFFAFLPNFAQRLGTPV